MGYLGDVRATDPLIAMHTHPDAFNREAAAHGLAELISFHRHDLRIIDSLLAALKDEAPKVRELAARGLGYTYTMDDADKSHPIDLRVVDALIAALNDQDGGTVREAAHSLVNLPDARAVEPLLKTVQKHHAFWKDPKLASDKRRMARRIALSAIYALGATGDRRAIGPLIALVDGQGLVNESELTISQQAVRALENSTG